MASGGGDESKKENTHLGRKIKAHYVVQLKETEGSGGSDGTTPKRQKLEAGVRSGESGGTTPHAAELEAAVLRLLQDKLMPQIAALVQGVSSSTTNVSTDAAVVQVTSGHTTVTTPSTTGKPAMYWTDTLLGRRVGGNLTMSMEMLEPFDPDDEDANIERWVSVVDKLGDVYGWTPVERSYMTQAKLHGAARTWFNLLEDSDRTWEGWKEALRLAFPRKKDFATKLRELMKRQKMADETMSAYYHSKAELCQACKIMGEDAVSIIIDGLPEELKADARALKCKTPEMLYSEFLVKQKNYQTLDALKRTKATTSPDKRPAQ